MVGKGPSEASQSDISDTISPGQARVYEDGPNFTSWKAEASSKTDLGSLLRYRAAGSRLRPGLVAAAAEFQIDKRYSAQWSGPNNRGSVKMDVGDGTCKWVCIPKRVAERERREPRDLSQNLVLTSKPSGRWFRAHS